MNQTPNNLKPVRQSVFAVWQWSRWTWWSIVPLLIVTYFLSAIPVERVVRQKINYRLAPHVKTFYYPVRLCVRRSTGLRRVLDHENAMLDRILGPELICARY